MATIVKRKNKQGEIRYRVLLRSKNAPKLSATFSKLSDARKWASVKESAILEGKYFAPAHLPKHTLAELIDRYSSEILPLKKPSTIPEQARQLRWWKTQLEHYALDALTPSLIAEHRDALRNSITKRHTRRSAGTVNRYLAVLSHAFTIAVKEWQWCEENPVRKITKPKEPRGRVRFLSEEERERLLIACKASKNPHLHTIVVLALATGARRGELLSLHWSNVDLERGMLTFRETKNGEYRAVPLAAYALRIVREHTCTSAFVFPNSNGTKPTGIREAFENAVHRAHITDFRFHDLRHTFASYLAMNGASLLEIAEVLGHKTLAMVKRYAHLTEAHTRSVVERMNQRIFPLH